MTELSEKPFRAKQLYDWMHVKLAGDYDEMTNLSAALRNRLKEGISVDNPQGSA